MVHESLHILLGAMRVQNINNYKDILDYFLSKNDINKSIINGESKYKNLAYLDRVEEAVVRYIANAIYNSKTLYKEDTNPIIDDFIKQFNRLRADTKKELSVKLDSDLDFVTSAKTLITTNLKSA
jgi:hypothetical protein